MLSVVAHACNSSTWEVEAGDLQPELHVEAESGKTVV
jgi:hypothetical protein